MAEVATDAGSWIIRLIGPFLVLVVWIILALYLFAYFRFMVPMLGLHETWMGVFLRTPLGLWIWFGIAYNHVRAVLTCPGYAPKQGVPTPPNIMELVRAESQLSELAGTPTFHCQHCLKPKPLRAHHCRTCKRCVLKQDHHCPWINGCVGQRNYRFFFLFLMYLVAGCFFVLACCLPIFWRELPNEHLLFHPAVLISTIFAGCSGLAVGGLFCLHVHLVVSGQTTIEMHQNKRRRRVAATLMGQSSAQAVLNPFDLGIRRNFEAVFGPRDMPPDVDGAALEKDAVAKPASGPESAGWVWIRWLMPFRGLWDASVGKSAARRRVLLWTQETGFFPPDSAAFGNQAAAWKTAGLHWEAQGGAANQQEAEEWPETSSCLGALCMERLLPLGRLRTGVLRLLYQALVGDEVLLDDSGSPDGGMCWPVTLPPLEPGGEFELSWASWSDWREDLMEMS